ncbi:LysE family translocator [Streptomyces fulvorobeus]|uniref:Amino acid transporter LysE n=1 Tax=Streptomyces fulvorobeus TaxID=284028 RepID=A0A7J0BZ00_9ACTN|nr:LysE family translocator [Streptomyces fulvorobeus]NYE39269.1 threonine/homoserine/homoserine lactone efflux protein [Streptomyces fulvorobeus]GFM95479.1 amino acid transporter LysE [Streptomyces fulvorobeus]
MSANILGFLGVVLVAYAVPGPDFLVIVRAAATRRSLGRAAAFGAQAGLCVHVAAAVLGLSLLVSQSALAFTLVKLAGAAYLVHLGVRTLLATRRSGKTDAPGATERDGAAGARPRPAGASWARRPGGSTDARNGGRTGWWQSFTEGLLTNVLNPKASLFFLSVLPQFVDHDSSRVREQILVLGILDVAVGVVLWLGLVAVAGGLRTRMARPAFRRRWDRVTGSLLVAMGMGVAVAD